MPNFIRTRVGRLVGVNIVIGAMAVCSPLLAQSASQSVPTKPLAASTTASTVDSLVVGPGDTLHIVVFDSPDLEQRVSVTDGGNANFSLVGDVHVAGMSGNQVARTLEDLYIRGHFLTHPNVNVMIEQSATMQVSVLGEVHNPGSYEISTSRNILEVISLAGGLTDVADRNITIKRKQGTTDVTTVFVSNDANDAIAKSAMVYPGDTVIVPKAGLVYVLGDVGKPGGYYMQRDSKLSVLQAVGMAGGLLPTAAAPHSLIVRKSPEAPNGYVNIPEDIRAMQKGKKPDVQLQADDVIYVPFSYARNTIIQSPAILASATSAIIYTAY
jgi:polysaccharide export outer membrane protein